MEKDIKKPENNTVTTKWGLQTKPIKSDYLNLNMMCFLNLKTKFIQYIIRGI